MKSDSWDSIIKIGKCEQCCYLIGHGTKEFFVILNSFMLGKHVPQIEIIFT